MTSTQYEYQVRTRFGEEYMHREKNRIANLNEYSFNVNKTLGEIEKIVSQHEIDVSNNTNLDNTNNVNAENEIGEISKSGELDEVDNAEQ